MSIATPPSNSSIVSKSEPPMFSTDAATLFPHDGPWTEAEYLALDTNRVVEFSDGNLWVVEMPTESHQDILGFLYETLKKFVKDRKLGKVNLAGLPVKLWEGKIREPDILFMLAEHSHRRHDQKWDGADLTMEIVSTDRRHDLETKKSEYARAGIPEYWIVDPLLKEITVLKLVDDAYEPAGIYHPGDQAASVLLAGFAVNVIAVFEAN